MSTLLDAMKTKKGSNKTLTENGAKAFVSTKSGLLDLFSRGGAYRDRTDEDIVNLLNGAVKEDVKLAIKLVFYLRDIKGAGEKRFFKVALKHLVATQADRLAGAVKLIPLYGRWDDLLDLIDTPLEEQALAVIGEALARKDKMAAKWMPREGSKKGTLDKRIPKLYRATGIKGDNPLKQWRKLLAELSDTVEHKLAEKQYDQIDLEKVQGKAVRQYKKAWKNRIPEVYTKFVNEVASGTKKVKVGASTPAEIIHSLMESGVSKDDEKLIEGQWNAQPNYLEGGVYQNILPIVDVSGSMVSALNSKTKIEAIDVSVGLGIYCAERITGYFKNHMMTFSSTPEIVELKGKTLKERVTNARGMNWNMSTDIIKAFDLILNTATRNKLPQSELPDAVLIISDMEFNSATSGNTPFKEIKSKFEAKGYKLPVVVFWNVNARHDQSPVKKDEGGTILVSGYAATVVGSILKGQELEKEPTPYESMIKVLESERYAPLDAALA